MGLSGGSRLPLAELPDLMEQLHFAVIGKYGYRPGPWLRFEMPETVVTQLEARRRWRMAGLLMRPSHDAFFELGISTSRAWVRVERFPSVFLSPGVPRPIRRLYEGFHAHVSYRYLDVLRAQLAR